MATRSGFLEPLNLEDMDQNQVSNWLERLDAHIELYLFDVTDKLPTIETKKKNYIKYITHMGEFLHNMRPIYYR